MRRRFGIVLPALLVLVALWALPAAAGVDAPESAPAPLVLAAEDGEPLGPEPQPRTDPDNPASELFPDMETQFTWGAAWLLTAAGIVGVAALIGLWLLLVRKPERDREEAGAA